MTVSTATRALAEVTAAFAAFDGLRLVIVAGGLGQIAGTALFVVNMWSRVRMPVVAVPPNR